MGGGLFLSSFQRIVVGELWPRYSTQLTKIRIPFPRRFPLILPVSEESHLKGHCPRVILTEKPSILCVVSTELLSLILPAITKDSPLSSLP